MEPFGIRILSILFMGADADASGSASHPLHIQSNPILRIIGLLPTGALIPSSTAAAYTLAMATAAAQAAQAAQLTQRFQQAAAVAQVAQGNSAGNYSALTGAPTGAYYIPGASNSTNTSTDRSERWSLGTHSHITSHQNRSGQSRCFCSFFF